MDLIRKMIRDTTFDHFGVGWYILHAIVILSAFYLGHRLWPRGMVER